MDVSTPVAKKSATNSHEAATLLLQMALDQKRAGRKLAALRKSRNLTQGALAGEADTTLRSIQRWESGERRPQYRNLDNLARALGDEVYEIFRDVAESNGDGPTPDPFHGTQLDRIETMLAEVLDLLRSEDDREEMERMAGPPPEIAEPRKTRSARSSR